MIVNRFLNLYTRHNTLFISRTCSVFFKLYSSNVDLVINGTNLNKFVEKLKDEYDQLKNSSNITRLSELQPIIDTLKTRDQSLNDLENLQVLLKDENVEIRKLAQEERTILEDRLSEINTNLKDVLCPQDVNDHIDAISLEINAGVGGQEAMLFAAELFNMYKNFAVYKGWQVDVADYVTTELGGIRHGSLLITGKMMFKYFKHEAGVHRVQRIPATEKTGRIHTSTVSVLALPQPNEIDVKLDPKDLQIETKRASGAGGQHVNTTDSAVRIVHLPTNTSVECQTDRSQIKNRQIALQRLRALLYQKQFEQQLSEMEVTRKNQVRSNFRNERIRTYNFSQDRITDHRLQGFNIHNLKGFLIGGEDLEKLILKLDDSLNTKNLLNLVNSVNNK